MAFQLILSLMAGTFLALIILTFVHEWYEEHKATKIVERKVAAMGTKELIRFWLDDEPLFLEGPRNGTDKVFNCVLRLPHDGVVRVFYHNEVLLEGQMTRGLVKFSFWQYEDYSGCMQLDSIHDDITHKRLFQLEAPIEAQADLH